MTPEELKAEILKTKSHVEELTNMADDFEIHGSWKGSTVGDWLYEAQAMLRKASLALSTTL